jgi:CPA2 family monovalent cation:H+ antiporter-2
MILLKDIILILFFAILIILALSKLRIPPVIGFLITGVFIGPSALHLVESIAEIEVLAEIGIILLMFTIGLEFSMDKIRKMLDDFLLFGGLQVGTSWLAFSFLLYWYGLTNHQAFVGGFILALSSTAIVLKLLQDNDALNSPYGLKMTSILLFQDGMIIPAILLLPFMFQQNQGNATLVILNVLLAFGGIILIFFVCKKILPGIFDLVLNLKVDDLLTVTIFVLLFGVALLAHKLGISLAMGALIVGIAISDSEYAHQINTDIIPSRHIFNSIFFISIGMFVNLPFLLIHFVKIILFTLVLIVLKIIIILALFKVSSRPLDTGIKTAFGLAHTGEFSFILLKFARDFNLFNQETHQLLLSSAIFSIFFIPFAFKIGDKISSFEKLKKELPASSGIKFLTKHTIIAGFGINGKNIARILKALEIPYLIAELNPSTVKKYKSLGQPIHFGSIERRENMNALGIKQASLLVIAINNMEAAGRAVKLARNLNPSIKIIVRSNFIGQVETFYNLGADLVLSQDMETSLIFIHHILKFYNMPDHVSRIQTNLLRKEHYRFFLKTEAREAWKIAMLDYIEQDNELFFVGPFSRHVSKKLAELDAYHFEDMNIIGIIRHNKVLTQSLQDTIIEKYDTIIFSGNHKKVYEALSWMEEHN